MIETILNYTVDLSQGTMRTPIKPVMALLDKNAHVFRVFVTRDGKPETITGVTCSGTFLRSDNVSVPVSGGVDGSVASVTLNEACYRIPGRCKLTINLVDSGVENSIFIGDGSVMITSTDTIVDDERIIPSLEEIAAKQQEAIAATNAANQAAKNANAAAETANNAATAAISKADGAVEEAKNNVADAILNVNSSVQNANAAAENANEKARVADEAADRANDAAKAAEDVVGGALPFFDGEPSAPGEASAGTLTQIARGDHAHPLPTLLPISNGGTGATSAEGISQNTRAFHIVGSATDANTALTIGLYGTTSATKNLPSGVQYGNIFNVSSSYTFNNKTGIIDQFFIPIGGGRIWRRSNYNENEWTDWTLVALDAYPVGSIYMSYVSTSPASLFGGKWVQIQDRFLVGVGSSYTAGATGGANSVTLTEANLPASQVPPVRSTDRFVTMCSEGDTPDGYITPASSGTLPLYWGGNWGTRALGDGSAHENRPPYFAVYMWRRTA